MTAIELINILKSVPDEATVVHTYNHLLIDGFFYDEDNNIVTLVGDDIYDNVNDFNHNLYSDNNNNDDDYSAEFLGWDV